MLLFEFSDYTSKYRRWWLVIKDGDVDVCLKDPGYDVKLHISTDIKTLTGIWMGDLSLGQALRNKLITVSGEEHLKRSMSAWLGTNYFADVKPARKTAECAGAEIGTSRRSRPEIKQGLWDYRPTLALSG